MTAAESIMAGRPIVSNPIVPALEILAPAAISARSNDWQSHAEAVLELARDRGRYRQLQAACAPLAEQFFDRSRGLTATLLRIVRRDDEGLATKPLTQVEHDRSSGGLTDAA